MRRVLALMMVASVLVAIPAGAAGAAVASGGCDFLNDPINDSSTLGFPYEDSNNSNEDQSFFAGEELVFTAALAGDATDIRVQVTGLQDQVVEVPGSISVTIPTDGNYLVTWTTDPDDELSVFWTVECNAAPTVDTTPPVVTLDIVPLGDDLFEIDASCVDETDGVLELQRLTLKVRWHWPVHVSDGQVIEWERGWPPEIEYDDGVLEVEAKWVRLRAKCVDTAGNKTFKTKWFRR